jgi:hypothetical protein
LGFSTDKDRGGVENEGCGLLRYFSSECATSPLPSSGRKKQRCHRIRESNRQKVRENGLQQEQHTGMLFMLTQQVQPALHIAIMHSQQAWIIEQQAGSPLVQVMQTPSSVISHLHMPIVRLQQQTIMPFIIMQHLHIPSAIMVQRFWIIVADILSSQEQVIFIPPLSGRSDQSRTRETRTRPGAGSRGGTRTGRSQESWIRGALEPRVRGKRQKSTVSSHPKSLTLSLLLTILHKHDGNSKDSLLTKTIGKVMIRKSDLSGPFSSRY